MLPEDLQELIKAAGSATSNNTPLRVTNECYREIVALAEKLLYDNPYLDLSSFSVVPLGPRVIIDDSTPNVIRIDGKWRYDSRTDTELPDSVRGGSDGMVRSSCGIAEYLGEHGV